MKEDEFVELRLPKSHTCAAIVIFLALSLVTVGVLIMVPKIEGMVWCYVIIVLSMGFALYYWWDRDGYQVRADAQGIRGCSLGFLFRRQFVPWSSVATCEIVTYYDTFGELGLIVPTLLDKDGNKLITLNLQFTAPADQEQLVKFIKAKLPKPEVDPWEFE